VLTFAVFSDFSFVAFSTGCRARGFDPKKPEINYVSFHYESGKR
jgi:hypothetical protein